MLGEVRRTLRAVRDPAHPRYAPESFDTRFTSDSLDACAASATPTASKVTHTYDAAGSFVKVTGSAAIDVNYTPGRAIAQFLDEGYQISITKQCRIRSAPCRHSSFQGEPDIDASPDPG